MANMSYCRFQNTLGDLRDCHGAFQEMIDDPRECGSLSREELQAAKALVVEALEMLRTLSDFHGMSEEEWEEDNFEDAVQLINDHVKTEGENNDED